MKRQKSVDKSPYWRRHFPWMVILVAGFGAAYTAIANDANKGALWHGYGPWLWFGAVYTTVVIVMGVYVIKKRKDSYIRKRTGTLMFLQVFLFFFLHRLYLPEELGKAAGYPWPLKITALYPWRPDWVLAYAAIFAFVALPIATYFYGRRVYCGWICSCGAIAETLGDPFRRRAPKGEIANRLEIGMYAVLLIAAIVTISVWLGFEKPDKLYYIVISFYISGIYAMGVYPFMGGRIWCRYFCPSGAFIGAISKRGRFAVTGDFDECIECGICSENCQMGIDVRDYITKKERIKTDQCVGCGICVSMCPVKILRFE